MRRYRTARWVLALGAGVAIASTAGACAGSADIADQRFDPTTAGVLTVATSLPAPGFWGGADVDHLTGGFEHGIADALATRFGLRLEVIDVPFDRLVAGDLAGADLALSQITITDEREAHLDFSVPYYRDDAGVVMRAGEELTDLKTAKEQRWVVERDTVQARILDDQVRPDTEPVLVDDIAAAVRAVAEDRADAALLDLSTALVLTKDDPDVTTAGRILVDGGMAAALPDGSDNVEVVDAGIRALESNGTLDDLASTFLAPVFEAAADSIPVIRLPSS